MCVACVLLPAKKRCVRRRQRQRGRDQRSRASGQDGDEGDDVTTRTRALAVQRLRLIKSSSIGWEKKFTNAINRNYKPPLAARSRVLNPAGAPAPWLCSSLPAGRATTPPPPLDFLFFILFFLFVFLKGLE